MRALALLVALGAFPAQEGDDAPAAGPRRRDKVSSEIVVHSFETLRDGLGRPLLGEWTSWVLEVENKSPRDQRLILRLIGERGGLRVSREETLSHGARKRFFFHLPEGAYSNWGTAVGYEIVDSSGQTIVSKEGSDAKSPMDGEAFQIGLFSGDKAATGAFGFPNQIGGRMDVGVVRLGARNFPDRWIGLAPFDAILIHDAPLGELGPDQAKALAEYVKGGGTLFLSPGPDPAWLRHPALAEIAAIRPGKPVECTALDSLKRFGPFGGEVKFLLHRIENGSATDWGREIVLFPAGLGRVYVLPFDLRGSPFRGWSGLDPLWTSLLTGIPRRFAPESLSGLANQSTEMIAQQIQLTAQLINPYPPFLLLVGIAVLFLAVVGPVNYLVLRRLGMTILVVVTVPLISGTFLLLIFGTGYILKGTTTVAHSVRMLTTRAGADTARETQLFTLFSPSTRSFEVAMAPGAWGLPFDRTLGAERARYRGMPDPGSSRLEAEESDGVAYKSVGVGQWQSWNLVSRAVRGLGGGVQFESSMGRVKITNLTPYAIRRGLVLQAGLQGSASPFGEIAPGKSLEVEVDPSHRRPYEDLGVSRESFEGLMLSSTLDPLNYTFRRAPEDAAQVPGRTLLCLLKEEDPTIRVDARLSGDSRSLTILQVTEKPVR